MARKSDLRTGVSILAIGVVLTIGSYAFADARGGGSYLICYGPIIFGLFRIGRALGNNDHRREATPPAADDPRWRAATDDQVVGQICDQCHAKIVVVAEGARCKTCSVPLHRGDCRKKHASIAHSTVTTAQ